MDRAFQHLEGRLERLLFVTSDAAREQGFADMADWLEPRVNGRLLTLAGTPASALEAAGGVRDKLREERPAGETIEGVVLLGDYVSIPSHRKLSVPKAFLTANDISETNADLEPDLWQVWSDDLYGHSDEDEYGLAEVAVSRLPLVPRQWLTPEAFSALPDHPDTLGRHASQFRFAESVYSDCLDPDLASPMEASPGAALYPPPSGHSLEATYRPLSNELTGDRVYLVLHGNPSQIAAFQGTCTSDVIWNPIAVDLPTVTDRWQTPAVVFGGVCWGALITPTMALYAEFETVEAKDVSQSIALSLLDRGAQAFVGFTALHKIPGSETAPHLFGEPLHRFFWENIRQGMPPAKALFHAKTSYLDFPPRAGDHPLSTAFDLKTFWSATCLGFGW